MRQNWNLFYLLRVDATENLPAFVVMHWNFDAIEFAVMWDDHHLKMPMSPRFVAFFLRTIGFDEFL